MDNEKQILYSRNNPLNYHGRGRVGTGVAILEATHYVRANVHNARYPFLILHSEQDAITECAGSRQFYEQAPSVDKTFNTLYNEHHAFIYDSKGLEYIRDCINWINTRC